MGERVTRARFQAFLELDSHLFGSEFNAHVDDPRFPAGGRRILPGVVRRQARRHIRRQTYVPLLWIRRASENVNAGPRGVAHSVGTSKQSASRPSVVTRENLGGNEIGT